MYGIVAFFKRFYFLLLFIALEVLSLTFVFSNNYYHQAGYFNSSNRIAGSVYSFFSGITNYFHLKTESRHLAEENVSLRNSLAGISDTSSHHPVAKTNPYGQHFNFILAEAIDNSTNLSDNYLTLNAGSARGIGEGMGVVSPDGIVGIVVKVSEHYSVVMSLLHKKCFISAMFKKSGTFGTLSWGDNLDYRFALLSQIPMSEKVKAGDTIVTSGYSDIFPKGTPVGEVENFKTIPEQYFYLIKVRLCTDFKNLRYVYVVKDVDKAEKSELEEESKNSIEEHKK
jgi:rod shape-determining protein MreC